MLALLGRIPVGFGGLQAGLQGRSSNASASLPAVCPIRLRGSSSGARGGPVVLHVINEHMGNLELLYVSGDTERRYWVIDLPCLTPQGRASRGAGVARKTMTSVLFTLGR